MAENEEKLKNLLMKVKEQNEKAGLKLSIQKTKITATKAITSTPWRTDSLEKTMILEKIEVRRRRGRRRMISLDGITDSMDMSLSELCDLVMGREAWHAAVNGVTKSWTWLRNWIELRQILNFTFILFFSVMKFSRVTL